MLFTAFQVVKNEARYKETRYCYSYTKIHYKYEVWEDGLEVLRIDTGSIIVSQNLKSLASLRGRDFGAGRVPNRIAAIMDLVP